MKSFLSLERSATFTCRRDGTEWKYLVYEGEEFVNYTLIHEKPTKEENGVIAELVIKDWSEKAQFESKAKAKLAYYDTVVLVIDGRAVVNEIHRNELFQWSTLNKNSNVHVSLKDVYYSIDYEALGIHPVQLPVAIRLELGDGITPTPSRESYITNDKVKALLLGKIKDICNWFVKRYNDRVAEFPDLIQAYNDLGNTNYEVPLNGTTFQLNPILKHATIKPIEPKVKGLKVRDGLFYKKNSDDLLKGYTPCGYVDNAGNTRLRSDKIPMDYFILHDKVRTVLVSGNFSGNIKDFLKRKYGKGVLFVRKNHFTWKLGGVSDNKKAAALSLTQPDSLYNLLGLSKIKRQNWREHIAEWNLVERSIVSTFKDETDVVNSKEFIDFLDNKKTMQKAAKAAGYVSKDYTGYAMGKQKGDITMAFSYERYGKIYFKKEIYPISTILSEKCVHVLLTDDEDTEQVRKLIKMTKCPNVKFAVVGKLERKKLPTDHYNFITLKQYMSMDSKPFMRMCSAILFRRVIKDYEKLSEHKSGVFKLAVNHLVKDVELLDNYQKDNFVYCGDKDAENAMIQAAEEHKLFDLSLWDVYLRVRAGLKKYDFVNLFAEPGYYDTENQKRYKTIINQVLLFRKKYYEDVDDLDIQFKSKPKTAKV